MEDATKFTAIRILREEIDSRTRKNDTIRTSFGDRITVAFTAECKQRDREIAAMEETISLIEAQA